MLAVVENAPKYKNPPLQGNTFHEKEYLQLNLSSKRFLQV